MSKRKRKAVIIETFCDHCKKLITSPLNNAYNSWHTLTFKEGRKTIKADLHGHCVNLYRHPNRNRK